MKACHSSTTIPSIIKAQTRHLRLTSWSRVLLSKQEIPSDIRLWLRRMIAISQLLLLRWSPTITLTQPTMMPMGICTQLDINIQSLALRVPKDTRQINTRLRDIISSHSTRLITRMSITTCLVKRSSRTITNLTSKCILEATEVTLSQVSTCQSRASWIRTISLKWITTA